MGLLDFLTKPRTSFQSGGSTALQFPQMEAEDAPGLLESPRAITAGAPVMAQGAPQAVEKGGLLSGAGHWLSSPKGLLTISSFLGGLGGDGSVGLEAAAGMRQERQREQTIADKKAAIRAKNAALRAAYRPGPDGRMRFDPAAFIASLDDSGADSEADLGELASLHNALAPKTGVSNDTAYSIDDDGNVTWGEERPWSRRDQEAADKADEAEQMRQLMYLLAVERAKTAERQGDARIGIAREREGRIGAGGGGGGGFVPRPTGRTY